jgi:hypothetical protein
VHTGRAAQTVQTWHDPRRASPCKASAPRSVGGPWNGAGNGAESRSDPGKNSRQRSNNKPALAAVYAQADLTCKIVPIYDLFADVWMVSRLLSGAYVASGKEPTHRFEVAFWR